MSEEKICSREGRWSEDLAAHMETCSSCREADRAAVWLRQLSVVPMRKPLPEAQALWLIAEASKPERLRLRARFLESLGALAIAAVVVVMAWSVIQHVVGSLVPSGAMWLVPLFVSGTAAAGLAAAAISSGIFREE
jgi:hypothetical protein